MRCGAPRAWEAPAPVTADGGSCGSPGGDATGRAAVGCRPPSRRAWASWSRHAVAGGTAAGRRARGHRRTGAGGHAGAGRLGPQGRRDDPAARGLCGQLARAPRPPRARVIDDDQGWGVGGPRAPAWSQVAWPRPHGATGEDCSGGLVGAIGHREGVRVDRQTARARARPGQDGPPRGCQVSTGGGAGGWPAHP
jgi:hypothetical protein